jgi:hypothetical protein
MVEWKPVEEQERDAAAAGVDGEARVTEGDEVHGQKRCQDSFPALTLPNPQKGNPEKSPDTFFVGYWASFSKRARFRLINRLWGSCRLASDCVRIAAL